MKKKYVFLFGLAVGLIVPLILAMNQYVNAGRYQLYFGKVIQESAETPVCFRLDTETGETKLYYQLIAKIKGDMRSIDLWGSVDTYIESPALGLIDKADPNNPNKPLTSEEMAATPKKRPTLVLDEPNDPNKTKQ